MKTTWLCLAACALLGACTGVDEGPPPPRATVNVFISPVGEPFRAGATGAYPLDVWFAQVDANHDGALTADEFAADAKRFFDRLDENHDGVIDGFEIGDYEQKVAPEILPRIGRLTGDDIPALPGTGANKHDIEQNQRPVKRRRPNGLNGAGMFSLTREPEPVAAADTDFDGKVSLQEMLAAARRRFALLDVNHDGRLLRAELPETAAARLVRRAPRRESHRTRPGA